MIGDLEFELHRPSHCKGVLSNRDDAKSEIELNTSFKHLSFSTAPTESEADIKESDYEIDRNQYEDEEIDTFADENEPFSEIKSETNAPNRSSSSSRKSRRSHTKIDYNEDPDQEETKTVLSIKDELPKKRRGRKPRKDGKKAEQNSADTADTEEDRKPSVANISIEEDDKSNDFNFDAPFVEPSSIPSESDNEEEDAVIKAIDSVRKKRKVAHPKTIPCPQCDIKVGTERTLKIHLKSAHGFSEKLECPICGREFKSAGNLKQHINTHSNSKRYICNYCGKGFHMPYNLNEHMHLHTGERPYKCETCGKTFGRQTLKQAHLRVSRMDLRVFLHTA